jgi:hypothetical protein
MSATRRLIASLLLLVSGACGLQAVAQPVTGIWKGRVGNALPGTGRSYPVEIKLVRDGDSLRGIAYYRTLGRNHIRMPVSGYINPYDGTVSWWHGARDGVDDRGKTVSDPLPPGMQFTTDYNCPDGTTLKLDGTAKVTTWSGRTWEMGVHLQKSSDGEYSDEWDRLIAIREPVEEAPPVAKVPVTPTPPKVTTPPASPPDKRAAPVTPPVTEARRETPPVAKAPAIPPPTPTEVRRPEPPNHAATPPGKRPEPVVPPAVAEARRETPPVAKAPAIPPPTPTEVRRPEPPKQTATPPEKRPEPVVPPAVAEVRRASPPAAALAPRRPEPPAEPGSPTERFRTREKTLVQEIEVAGDTLRLDFYDHAEVDGDSVSIFLGDRLIASHILLKATAHRLSIPVSEIGDRMELTMVAENLGTIPPNTSLLILYVDGIRHEARLESTERSSAMIRFRRPGHRD